MTLCLTFDDGLKTHAEIAVPALNARGWIGAFCVPTAFMDIESRMMTAAQIADLCIEGHEDNLMDWDDVRRIMADGHEVYPHTHDHVDLVELCATGRFDEVRRQVVLAKDEFVTHLGVKPDFHCMPHYSSNRVVKRIVRRAGMEEFNCGRANFGSKTPSGSVTSFLVNRKKSGWRHVDISVHGIDSSRGGWCPFATTADFEAFLDEIVALEKSGVVRVVPYSRVHPRPSFISPALMLWNRFFNRACVMMTELLKRQ